MKKILYNILLATSAIFITACSNDDILIYTHDSVNDVNVTVSLSNFFSSYNFQDTRHDISVTDDYRTFHSEHDLYIQVRTLIYDSNGLLVDSLLSYSTNTNPVTKSLMLSAGNYTAVSTLTFADKTTGDDASWWNLVNKEKLVTATMSATYRFSKWSIMSYDSKAFTVTSNQTTSISMNPQPIGALCYMYLQNFWCASEADYPTRSDNGIRALCLYSQDIAENFRLDPNAAERYIYWENSGRNFWYFMSDRLVPTDFDDDWTYFETNLYTYFYILPPHARMQFGYVLQGVDYFTGYGEATYNIQSGKTYLAYWDYFQIGNPYFGIADNNHWNTYSSQVKAKAPIKERSSTNVLHPFDK